jgi:hypothetical protein
MIETLLHFAVQGQRVTGTLCLPQGAPAPVVLMVHGFTGSRDEMAVTGTGEGVFSRSARRLAQVGGVEPRRLSRRLRCCARQSSLGHGTLGRCR